MANPLLDDRDVDFQLHEVLDATKLTKLPYYADHDRGTFDLVLGAARRFAREVLFATYRPLDEQPPRLEAGRIKVHPKLREVFPQMVGLDLIAAPRAHEVGGQQLPMTVYTFASAYLMAANLGAYGYLGLTQGAGHLIEAFGDAAMRDTYLAKMYRGEWLGTMALTEPQAGSSLADVQTTADPAGDGSYRITGNKIFISGGDHDLTENVVHMTLARVRGAPAGTKGISLFCVPRMRVEGGALVDNDVATTQMIHKVGWKGLPSLALAYGERGDCRGWLVGEPNKGLAYMFQMMNEARLMVGVNGVATASAAYHESLSYARVRTQGRPASAKDPVAPPVPLTRHADVRRMLLRQKAIVEGGMGVIARASYYADVAAHGSGPEQARAALVLDVLTPVAKSFPAEKGFEANALALQIHGGYGYSSEYLPESWLRDQKLNSIHEGTTGIQALDLLGRRAVAKGGAGLQALAAEIAATCTRARTAGVNPAWIAEVERALGVVGALTAALAERGMGGDAEGMVMHATDYLDLFSTVVVAWNWLDQAAAAQEGLARGGAGNDEGFYKAKLAATQYWIRTELPRVDHLAKLCREGEDSYAALDPDWL